MRRTLLNRLHDLLGRPELRGPRLSEALEQAGRDHGVEAFQACLGLVSRRSRSASEARAAITDIEAHRGDLERRLGRDPGFLVAAVDHLRDAEGAGWRLRPAAVPDAPRAPQSEAPFEDRLEAEIRRARRTGRPLVLALLAPRVPLPEPSLGAAHAALERARRDVDLLARLVPPVFALALPSVPRPAGERAVERLIRVAERATGAPFCAGLADRGDDLERLASAALRALRLARDSERSIRAVEGDRRRHRRALRPEVEVRVDEADRPAELLDLSVAGARLRTEEPLPDDATVRLRLRGKAPRGRAAEVRGRVIRRDPAADPGTAVLLFDDASEAAPDLAALLAGIPTLDREGRA